MQQTLILFILIPIAIGATVIKPDQVEFFEKKIRPVLAEACYECHNSVDKAKGDIALDWRDALIDSKIIVPGKPEESILMGSIRHDEDYEPMPSKKPKLSNLSIKAFEDWIRMGAPDPRDKKPTKEELVSQVDWDAVRNERAKWWSFQPIQTPKVPEIKNQAWNQNEIDRFIFKKIKEAGMEPQNKAEPGTLIRRLHLILIGVPPSPEVVLRFVANPTNEAYEKIVDELLASKAFGERWGRFWLDWFRYAESHGSEGDPEVPYATTYRDYVIRALNADVPYHQLIKEAVAGDLLEKPRINKEMDLNESAIGPGHFRMVPHGFGVTDAYDEQITFTDNQIDVLTKATMGMTLSCSRCHNHKFDPLSQEDFYKFYSMMITSRPGVVNVDSPDLQKLHREALKNLKKEIQKGLVKHWDQEVGQAIRMLENKIPKTFAKSFHNEGHPLNAWVRLEGKKGGALENEWAELKKAFQERQKRKQEIIKNATYYADLREQSTFDNWYKNGTGLGDEVSPAGSFAIAPEGENALTGIYPRGIYTHLITDKDNGTLGSPFHLSKGNSAMIRGIGTTSSGRIVIRSYPLSHGGLHPATAMKEDFEWHTQRKYSYWNNEQIFFQMNTGPDHAFRPKMGRSWFGITEVYAGEEAMVDDGNPIFTLPGKIPEIKDKESLILLYKQGIKGTLSSWQKGTMNDTQALLLESFRQHGLLSDKLVNLPADLQKAIEKYRKLESEIPMPQRAPGVIEGEPWKQPFLVQGNYKNEKHPVAPGFLEVFGGRTYPEDYSGRLDLAEDLVSDKNTLVTRVIVNRLWHHTFGRGLVSSTDNFGRLGKPPSHPDLLDHLATRFREDGWSIKSMIRDLVTSRTFQSSSLASKEVIEVDPENTLLTFYSPRRLDAEAIRDTMLYVAGRPVDRSVYRSQKRNNLDPFLTAFNLPVPTSTVGVRDLTNVPAQSLILLNGTEALNSANTWARSVAGNPTYRNDSQKIEHLFLQAFSRKPTQAELRACISFLSSQLDTSKLEKFLSSKAALVEEHDQLLLAKEKLLKPTRDRLQRELEAELEPQGVDRLDLKPVSSWDFENDLQDSIGGLHGTIKGNAKVENGALILKGGCVFTKPYGKKLRAKTLEVLVQLDNLMHRGGGAMTVQTLNGSVFDSIVMGEQTAGHWMSGSDHFRRTLPFNGPVEREADSRPVRITMVYEDQGGIICYRDGVPYGKPIYKSGVVPYAAMDAQVVFGLRHGVNPAESRSLKGKIYEARFYDRALSAEEVATSHGLKGKFVTRKQVLENLPLDAIKQLAIMDDQLKELQASIEKISIELEAVQRTQGSLQNDYARLTHALLNSKELIYVY